MRVDRRQPERVGDVRRPSCAVRYENVRDLGGGGGVAGQPADGVEGGGQRQHAGHVDGAVRGADSDQSLIGRGHPHRAAGVRAEPDVRLRERDRAGRAARGAAADAARRGRVGRAAVVRVGAGQAVGELVGARDAHDVRARGQQRLHHGCGRCSRLLFGEPLGVARAHRLARDREQVLHRDLESAQRSFVPAGNQWVADDAPDRGVHRGRRRGDLRQGHVRGGDLPATRAALPHLGLQPGRARRRFPRARHDQRRVLRQHPDMQQDRAPRRDLLARGPESGDRLMADEQHLAVAANRVRPGSEQGVEAVLIVGQQRRLVRPERVEQTGRNRLGCDDLAATAGDRGHRVTSVKSASRMRACAPLTPSTTWEISKSVAADT